MGYKKDLRRPEEVAESSGLKAYRKNEGEDDSYYTGKKGDSGATTPHGIGGGATPRTATPPPAGKAMASTALRAGYETTSTGGQQKQSKLQGTLTSDLLAPRGPKTSTRSTVTSTTNNGSGNNNKVHIAATTSNLRAPNAGLTDLEAALRALELTTNPTLNNTQKRPSCNCQATRHDLFLAAPNCLSCGKIICIKEGPGPCTFCGAPLLSSEETQDMISFLREERGREKMQLDARSNRKAEVSRTAKAYSQNSTALPPQLGMGYGTPVGDGVDEDKAALRRAKEHRDKLLAYQATNAQRTKIIDEAADFDTTAIASGGYSGLNMWATPEERALQLKKQQKKMREIQWASKEAWEKRRIVVSIDISGKGKGKGGPVVRREMKEVEMDEADFSDDDGVEDIRAAFNVEEQAENGGAGVSGSGNGSGQFAKNPLLKGMVRPVFTPPKPKKAKAENTANNNNDNYKGKGKPTAPPQIKDDNNYKFTGQADEYDDDDDDYDDNLELPEVVKARIRDAKMGARGVGGGGWKRVLQDEQDVKHNEQWILDGAPRDGEAGTKVETEEPACG